jgi:hypothetical protein
VNLMPTGYSFTNLSTDYLGVQIADRSEDLNIKWDLEFDFFKNEEDKRISLTMADIYFRTNTTDHKDDIDELEADCFGTFHEELLVCFSTINEKDKPASVVIGKDIKVHGCEHGKISYVEEISKEKRKGKEHGAKFSYNAGIHGGISIGVVGHTKHSKSEGDIHTITRTSEYNSTLTPGGFNVQEVTNAHKGVMGFKFLAPCTTIEDLAHIWIDRGYRNRIRTHPSFQEQRLQFSGSLEP